MMSIRRVWFVLGIVACGIGGCGAPKDGPADTDLTGDTDPTASTPTVQTVCTDLSEAICGGLSDCGCRFDVRPYTADTCVASRTATCVAGLGANVQMDLDAGRARFDPASVAACVAAVEAMATDCALPRQGGLPEACNALVVDAADAQAPCTVQGGGLAYCDGGAGLCVPGEAGSTCTPLPVAGEDCPQGFCAAGLVCGALLGQCAAPGQVGGSCVQSGECNDGLACGPDGACVAPRADGASCTADDQCQEGLRCDDTRCAPAVALDAGCADPAECGASRSCGRAPETRTCGDADALDEPCGDGTCASGLACGATDQTCEALPSVDETCLDGFACGEGLTCADGLGVCAILPGQGEICAVGNRFCDDGLGCDPTSNTCEPGPGEGEACLLNPPDYVCAEGLGCDFGASGSLCVVIGGVGSACNSDRTCAPDTFCDYGTLTCTSRLADGGACTDGNECAPGSTCTQRPSGFVCAPIPARSEPCADVCGDGSVCKGPGGQCVLPLCVIP